jgi:hypothetical protein
VRGLSRKSCTDAAGRLRSVICLWKDRADNFAERRDETILSAAFNPTSSPQSIR